MLFCARHPNEVGRIRLGGREAQPGFSGQALTLAAWTSLRVPERVMRRVSDRAPSASRSHSILAPVLRHMARTLSPPFPGGGRATGAVSKQPFGTKEGVCVGVSNN